jgi:hypothetical protein
MDGDVVNPAGSRREAEIALSSSPPIEARGVGSLDPVDDGGFMTWLLDIVLLLLALGTGLLETLPLLLLRKMGMVGALHP